MKAPFSHLIHSLTAAVRAAESLATRPLPAAEWAAAVAGSLLELIPAARLALCARTDDGPPATAVRTADGGAAPEAAEAVRAELRRPDAPDGGARPSRALGAAFEMPCLAAAVRDGHGPWALLAVGLPPDSSPEVLGAAEAPLTVFVESLRQGRWLHTVETERDELARFALIGQATTGLAHDVMNMLSSINLQVSVLQLRLEEKHHGDLDVIRRQALQAANLLLSLGRLSGERSRGFRPVDLNRALAELLHADPDLAARVRFTPAAAAVPPVRGADGAMKQLLRLLLSAAAARSASPLMVRTDRDADGVLLVFEGLPSSEEDADGRILLTDPTAFWSAVGGLERLAGQSLLRGLSGALHAAPRSDGGFIVHVRWPVSP